MHYTHAPCTILTPYKGMKSSPYDGHVGKGWAWRGAVWPHINWLAAEGFVMFARRSRIEVLYY
jgi:hypothetical protein